MLPVMTGFGVASESAHHQIAFAISELRARNGHHRFEDLCRRYASSRISPNILPATGPVSSGGDQGRDFETFRTHDANQVSIVGACTLQRRDLPSKIKSDVEKIAAGEPVDVVYCFLGENMEVSQRHQLIQWAKVTYQVSLEIIDRNALAELISAPTLHWIAEEYLGVPSLQSTANILVTDRTPGTFGSIPRNSRPLIGRSTDLTLAQKWLVADADNVKTNMRCLVVTGSPGVGRLCLPLTWRTRSLMTFQTDKSSLRLPNREVKPLNLL